MSIRIVRRVLGCIKCTRNTISGSITITGVPEGLKPKQVEKGDREQGEGKRNVRSCGLDER